MATRKKQPAPVDPVRQAKLEKTLEMLRKVRESKTVQLKPSRFMRTTCKGLDGTEQPFHLRYYQVQGAYHLLALQRMVLGDDTGTGKCLTSQSILLTDQGFIPIWQLCPEGKLTRDTFYEPRIPVKVWTGSAWAAVLRFYWNGVTKTRRITTRNGYSIEGSLAHPILVRDVKTGIEAFVRLAVLDPKRHWVCLDRSPNGFATREPFIPLQEGFHVATQFYKWPLQLTPPLARLLGYIVGEAWTRSRVGINVHQDRSLNPEVHADMRDLFQRLYGWSGNSTSATRDISIIVSSVHIRAHLSACGVDSSLAAKKRIPWIIAQGTQESVREFLRGLLDSEGSVARDGGYEFTSASKLLASTVQQLLLRFGVISTLAKKRVKGREHTYWRLTFFGDDARVFMERIGLVSTRKIVALNDLLERESNPNKDVVPGMGEYFEGVRERLGNISRFGNAARSTLVHVSKGRRNPSYRFLFRLKGILDEERLLSDAEFLEPVLAKRFFYDPIATIEPRRAHVMDIEVDDPSHAFVGNGFINHNTIQAISAFSHMFERSPEVRVVIATPKSTVRQWAREILRFTQGIRPIVIETSAATKGVSPLDQRKALYREWLNAPTDPESDRVVLLINYALLLRDWNAEGVQPVDDKGKPDPKRPVVPGVLDQLFLDASKTGSKLVVFFDEAQAFANTKTKTSEVSRYLSDRAERVYGLTATLMKSNLMEGYSIYRVVKPGVFGSKTAFMNEFCVTQLQKIPGTKRKIPIVVGYKNLEAFRQRIEPFYLGRKKQDVSDELPVLISKDIVCELTSAEDAKYSQALTGVLELGDGTIKDYEQHKVLVALNYCQQVVNSLSMLKFEEGSVVAGGLDMETLDMKEIKVGALGSKEQALLDLVADGGELEGEKVIVYTRFASLVPRLQKILGGKGITTAAITGDENDKKRAAAQEAFQDPASQTRVIFISSAGGVGINLQMARAMVFYELPWTWGDYIQLLGRMIRIGSPHRGVVTYHLMAERPSTKSGKTIDQHTYGLLLEKKDLIDRVLGEAAVGALDFEKGSGSVIELLRAMQADALAA